MNRGDTVCLMLNYQLNGEDLIEGAYDEIELQINSESNSKSIKKLLSEGDITWETVTYDEEVFTGYVTYLDQSDTFKLSANENTTVQLRIKKDGEVGSSECSNMDLGKVLSAKIL